jgi:alcohol dehydrogenase (cytochrome c)
MAALGLLALALGSDLAAQDVDAGITFERIRDARSAEPGSWLTYSGAYDGQRRSLLDQITAANVEGLSLRWVHQLPTTATFETTPIVADGVMYISNPPLTAGASATIGVQALDLRTGRPFWSYQRPMPDRILVCCGPVNRGTAILGHRVFVGTIDAHLLALDARTGTLDWDVHLAQNQQGYSITSAPLAVKDMVVTGIAGGEMGIKGFIDAYDAKTGERRWRFMTTPEPGEPAAETWGPNAAEALKTGAGSTWGHGSYDPDLDLVYWGVGHAGPDYDGRNRPGDNFFTQSVVALDADTGELRWFFQFTPGGTHDFDSAHIPVLIEREVDGRVRKLLVTANRNGFYYVLDRETGEYLNGTQFAAQTWAEGLDENGRPIRREGADPSHEGSLIAPSIQGATNWWSPSYLPETGLFYVNAYDAAARYFLTDQVYQEGHGFHGGFPQLITPEEAGFPFVVAIRALDALTGELVWEFQMDEAVHPRTGILSTVTGLLFTGTPKGQAVALDARTGEPLWHMNLGGSITSNPTTFLIDGEQHVAYVAGNAVFVFGLPD